MDDDGDTQMVIAEVTDAWDDELYEEYRATFSDDQWREEIEQRLYPAVVGRYNAMSFFEKEKPYDLMMSTLYILLKAADWITVSRFLRDQKQQKDFNFVFSAILRV